MGNASIVADQAIRLLTANHVEGLVHILVHAVYAKVLAPTQSRQNPAFHVMVAVILKTTIVCAVAVQESGKRQA